VSTKAEQFEQVQLALPGLELSGELNGRPDSALRQAVQATLVDLSDSGLLLPRHTALAQLALELADATTAGARSGRASAAAMAAGQLRDTLLALPAPTEAGSAEAFVAFVETLRHANDAPAVQA
jgi:hypothetical protein